MKTRSALCAKYVSGFCLMAIFAYGGHSAYASQNCSPKGKGSGELCSYRYELSVNKNDTVCKHMKEIFDWNFARPFDLRGFSEQLKREALFPLYSHYPSSDEFETITWTNHMLNREGRDGKTFQWPAPMAKFDIDNDGEEDFVIKDAWLDGSTSSFESLLIYKKGEFDPTGIGLWGELYGQPTNRPRVVQRPGGIIRPFIFNGTSYLMMYESTGRGPYSGKQTMWVRQYKSGGRAYSPGNEDPLVMEDICKFNMTRYSE